MVATNTTAKKPARTTRQTKSAEKIVQSGEEKLVQLLADTPVQIFPYSRLSRTDLNTRIIPHNGLAKERASGLCHLSQCDLRHRP